jgi:alkanesulfonate monooxygenase SsuD/methylene tetrahydromethanopterin reductase-like flavin-dependent oxidoreductase (luciferase family)
VTILSVPRPSPELLRGLTREALELAAAGTLRPTIAQTFPLGARATRTPPSSRARPSARPFWPILIGGNSPAALRRAVRQGAGRFCSMTTPQGSRTAPASFPRQRRSPWAAWLFSAPTRRTRASTSSSPHSSTGRGIPPEDAVDLPITGTPAQAAERFAAYAYAGAIWLVLGTISDDWHAQWKLIAEAAALLD